jgi:hypothetical protein
MDSSDPLSSGPILSDFFDPTLETLLPTILADEEELPDLNSVDEVN